MRYVIIISYSIYPEGWIQMIPIAHIHTVFPEKFGIPRQSGIENTIESVIEFEPEFAVREALAGLDGFSHIWIIWEFSENIDKKWSPTVRPPRLGGNARRGVFATRSPVRPNPIGLSAVKISRIEYDAKRGPLIYVLGADMKDNTPIFDIKPYIPFSDCIPDAKEGFTHQTKQYSLCVTDPSGAINKVEDDLRKGLETVLSNDPRPSYQNDPDRIYFILFSHYQIKFSVSGETLIIKEITEIQ